MKNLSKVNKNLLKLNFTCAVRYDSVFLQKIEERGNRTTHNLHKIQLDLDKAQVALGNTTNRLMSLQHSQFVENRVYDDDETFASTANISDISQPTTEKPNLVDALQYALSSGVKMMDKYYEKVTFELSDDSEDDEVDEAGQSSKRYFSIAMCQKSMCIMCLHCFQYNFSTERSVSKSSIATLDRLEGLAREMAHRIGRFRCGRCL